MTKVSLQLLIPPDPDTPTPDHTNRTQDMINISIFADPTTEDAENVCHLCKKRLKNGTGKKINLCSCCKKHQIAVTNKSSCVTNESSNLNVGTAECQQLRSFSDVKLQINDAYEHIIKWRRNLFTLPKGRAGKMFVQEITDLIQSWCNKTKWRKIALKAVMIMPSLLLQKVSPKSKSSENKKTP